MLDELLLNRFQNLLDTKMLERRKQFPIVLAQIDSQAAAKWGFFSGNRLRQVHQTYEWEFEARSIIAWQGLVRVHRMLGCTLSETLRDDLKAEINRVITLTFQELNASLQKHIQKPKGNFELSLEDTYTHVIKKHEIEVDLYVDSLTLLDSKQSKHPMTQQYNFYGIVGAVQTGANTVANVIQNLGPNDQASLSAALAQVREALGLDVSLSEQQKRELLEIADECSTQIASQSPNSTKLLNMFNVLGTAIQSIASAQPAYQALKIALLPLGITLP